MNERVHLVSEKLLDKKDLLVQTMKHDYPEANIPQKISKLIEKRCKSLKRQSG